MKYTKSVIEKIKNEQRTGKNFVIDLTEFKKRFTILINHLIFSILGQITIAIIIFPIPQMQYTFLSWIYITCLAILFLISYFKIEFYIFFHYGEIFSNFEKSQQLEKSKIKYQKFNSLLNAYTSIFGAIFAFLVNLTILILIFFPIIYIIFYYEQKAKYTYLGYNKFIYLITAITSLAIISFGILPLISNLIILSIQFIAFLLSCYFVLELFVKFKYFKKDIIRLVQNFLALASFFLIAYLLYPFIFSGYITYTSDPFLILFSGMLLRLFIFLIILLISFYRFLPSFYKKSLKAFKICTFGDILLSTILFFILINIRTYFLVDFVSFLNMLLLSIILLPTILLLFLYFNYLIGVFSYKDFLENAYYLSWFLISTIYLTIAFIFYNFISIIIIDLILISISSHYLLNFGLKIGKVKQITLNKFININSYILVFELFYLLFSMFVQVFSFLPLFENFILSSYLSSIIISVFVNISFRVKQIFSESNVSKFNIFILFYSTLLTYYFTFLITQGSIYVFILPIIFSSLVFYLLIYYVLKKEILTNVVRYILVINSLLLFGCTVLLPTIFGIELVRLGFQIDLFIIIILNIAITFGFSKILEYIGKHIDLKKLYILYLKFGQVILWFLLVLSISFELISVFFIIIFSRFLILGVNLSILLFFFLNIYNFKQINEISIFLSKNKDLLLKFINIKPILEYFRIIVYYGIIITTSFLFSTFIHISNILGFFPQELEFLIFILYPGFFLVFILIFFKLSDSVVEIRPSQYLRNGLKVISWIYIFFMIPVLSFILILFYTIIPIFYNITISLFLLLSLIVIRLYFIHDVRYKWLIKPTILLLIFDITSWVSYFFLFTNQEFYTINQTLIFTLTAIISGFAFIFLYNDSSEEFRNRSFYFVLTSNIIYFPIFIYFFLILYFPIPLEELIALIIAIDLGIILFYFSVGIYQWKLSWGIWKNGWWMWNLLPIVNFIIIYRIVAGVNVYTNAINILGDYDVLIITIIMCTLIELPALYTWVKEHFFQILFVIWGESLFLVYFISLNLFSRDLALTNFSFVLFSIISMMPLIYKLKYWQVLSKMWLILAGINVLFIYFLMNFHKITNFNILISVAILNSGLFFLVYSYFPNIKNRALILIFSYSIIVLGIFLTILFIIFSIILNFFISINFAFIIMAIFLFSSKFLKIYRQKVNLIAAWILIVNFSLLFFNTFILIPGMELFAASLAVTIFGGSFFVFNHYNIIGPINKGIPWMIMGFGLSLSISSLFLVFIRVNLLILIIIFSTISLIFLFFALDEYLYIMLYLIPIPLAFLVLDILLLFEIFQGGIAIIIWLSLYLCFFQLLINFFSNLSITELKSSLKVKNIVEYFKIENRIKIINFTCFIINSTYISLILVYIINEQLVSQILLFLIIWPILLLLSFKYSDLSKLNQIFPPLYHSIHKMSIALYFLLPIAISINIAYLLFLLEIEFIFIFFAILIFSSGILFVEVFIIDGLILKFLIQSTENRIRFYSWLTFCNTLCLYFYFFHLNLLLLLFTLSIGNLISLHFLNQLPIKNKEHVIKIRIIFSYISFITLSFYISSFITVTIISYYQELSGIASNLLFFLNAILLIYIMSYFFNYKVNLKLNSEIEFALILTIHIMILAFYLVITFLILILFNLFIFGLVTLIETLISFKSIKCYGQLIKKENTKLFLSKVFSFITLALYLELDFVFFCLCFEYFDLYESILISQIILFSLTFTDHYYLKKLKQSQEYLIHSISYFLISYFIFQLLVQIIEESQYLLSFILFLFISMQFYTHHSIFNTLNHFFPNKKEKLELWRYKLLKPLGVIFYSFLIFFVYNALFSAKIGVLLSLLILCVFIHGLMYLDKILLKFLGLISMFFSVISWISIMMLSLIFLLELFLFSFLILPFIIFSLIMETCYLFMLLEFIQKVKSRDREIKRLLLSIMYINFISWPFYYTIFNGFIILNLFLISFIILYILTYVDNYFKLLRENIRFNTRIYSFITIGFLLSTDIFIFLEFFVNTLNPFFVTLLNLSIASLILLLFIAIEIKPFKEHSLLAIFYWNISFLFVSIIFYYIFLSLQISVFFFLITFALYWFVFFLERIREIFSKIIDIFLKVLTNIKRYFLTLANMIMIFIKQYFKTIWIIIAIAFSSVFAFLLSSYLNPVHLTFSTLALFGLLYSVLPSKKTDNPDKIFILKMKRLIIIWGSIIGFIFIFIPLTFIILTVFIAILILGAILLPYIYYQEKRQSISIKWRFYTLIFFIIILIITSILIYLQISGFIL